MARTVPPPAHLRVLLPGLLALIAVGAALLYAMAPAWVAARVHRLARARGLEASWQGLRIGPPFSVSWTGLALVNESGDTAFVARALEIGVGPMSVLTLQPRPSRVRLAGARIALDALRGGRPDSLEASAAGRRARADHLPALRRTAGRIVRVLTLPADRMPVFDLEDVTFGARGHDGDGGGPGGHIESLRWSRRPGGSLLSGGGALDLEQRVAFAVALDYRRDGRLAGSMSFLMPGGGGIPPETLRVAVDATLRPERRPRGLALVEGSRVTLGRIPFLVSGHLLHAGPALDVSIGADSVRQSDVTASVPAALLGPLTGVAVRGSFGYRVGLDLDLSRPDSVEFHADVLPHGLALDPARTRLRLAALDQPFTATIHLPRGRTVTRELSPASPAFRPLEAMDSTLVHAVVTNEDGGFFRHHGFNTDAVREAIAENLRAGGWRRGAGTITMQLARNLYLGHERTLSRKAQEVALAWILEHLSGVSKRRLLEIYLNIIEWGPGVHGADEATRYYFGHDAGRVTPDEALFLATVVPSPLKWRYRFERDGSLRAFERAQMHFIGRAMVAKGWLDPAALPGADSLRVTLAGPAGMELAPAADTSAAAPDDDAPYLEEADADTTST